MCTACKINPEKADAFAEQLIQTLNQGALSLMLSIGHRTGLFDTMKDMPPSTSLEIAKASGLNERYVREWLGAMTTSQVVETHGDQPKFHLPAEHAAFLTRAAGADNIGIFAQYISQLGQVEDPIINCFQNGGGVPYAAYSRFHEIMAEDSGQSVLSSLIDTILPLVDGLTEKLQSGIEVLDIGCGSGLALILMAQTFPNSQFTGYDLCLEPLESAYESAKELGLTNIQFQQKDLTWFDPKQQFDFITAFDAIHDQARPDNVLTGIYKALKPDGTFLMQDIDASSKPQNNIDHPIGTLLYTVSCMHCMTVSLAQQDGVGLGAMWGVEKAQQMLKEAGFSKVTINRLEHDFQNCYYVIER